LLSGNINIFRQMRGKEIRGEGCTAGKFVSKKNILNSHVPLGRGFNSKKTSGL
jgi:hypothetical protein